MHKLECSDSNAYNKGLRQSVKQHVCGDDNCDCDSYVGKTKSNPTA